MKTKKLIKLFLIIIIASLFSSCSEESTIVPNPENIIPTCVIAQPSGYKSIIWDGTNELNRKVGSGIYIYKLRSGEYSLSKKMMLMK